jgi:hypothetical protein
MKALNSVGLNTKAPTIARIGVLAIAAVLVLLYLVPIFSAAAGTTVTVTATSAYGQWVNISGSVSPAPGASGYEVGIAVQNSGGQAVIVADANVNGTTGDFNYTYTGVGNLANDTYSVTVAYEPTIGGPTYDGSASFNYGFVQTTTSTSQTCTCTTVYVNATTTVEATTTVVLTGGATTTTVSSPGATTTVVQQGATVTSIVQTQTTVTLSPSSSSSGVGTAEAIGAVGVVIAVIAGALSVFALRKH